MIAREAIGQKDRSAIAEGLRRLADRVESEVACYTLCGERPVRELDPLRGECEWDGMVHYEPGPRETWILTIDRIGT